MKEDLFWLATANYYFFLALAVTREPYYLIVALPLFLVIPSFSGVELVPGIKDSMEAQTEVFKSQRHLDKEGYYE